jgi:prepilin-type N-terminal cleavage/methylation domain-containing protein
MKYKRRQAGFTLMEMLIVLVIMGIISSLFLTRVSKKPKILSPKLIQFLENERGLAISQQKTTRIQRDQNRLYSTLSKHSYLLTDKLNKPEQNRKVPQLLPYETLTIFFADGTATARIFSLTEGTTTYEITTSPFSNKIKFSVH